MKEKTICIVTPEGRTYYHATQLAKEFLDKDQNIIHTAGTLPDGEVDEFKVATKTVKNYKNGKLDGSLEVIDLTDNKVTFTEQYKNGVLIDLADHTLHGTPIPVIPAPVPSYQGTIVKVNKGTQSFYVDGKEVAEQTLAANGSALEQLGQVPDGPVKEFDENNQVRMEVNYRDNKPEGELVRYNEKGQLISKETYVQGVRQGPAEYYVYVGDKISTIHANYKNAQLHGEWTLAFSDGKTYMSALYQNGKLQGMRRTLYNNGQLNCEEVYENGKRQGPRRVYYPEGGLWYEENYKNGRLDGDRMAFFRNGSKWMTEFYTDGLLEGTRQVYAEDGNLLLSEEYHWGSLVHNTETRPF